MFQDQPYQLPKADIPIKFTPTTGNFVRVWVTAAPKGSKLEGRLALDTQNARVQVWGDAAKGEGGVSDTWHVELDKGGAYVFTLQEYQRGGSSFQGGYEGDPSGYTTETKIGAEVSQSIYIGERMSMRLGTGSHGFADLIVYAWAGTIRQTTIALHEETTPAVLNPTTRRAEAAVYSSTVAASVAALIDLPTADLLPNIDALIDEMIDAIPDHFGNVGGVWHGALGVPDTINGTEIANLPRAPTVPEGFARAAQVLRLRLSRHMENESDGSESDRHTYPDFANALIAQSPPPGSSNPATIWAAIADVWRAYEAHRQLAAVHNVADTTNRLLTTLDPLLVIHRDFLEAMLPLSPTAPSIANPGVTDLAQLGFQPDPVR
jgi:hypothetical protein